MKPLLLADRAEAYRRAFPDQPAAWPTLVLERGLPVLYATWLIGNDYRNRSKIYGAYPRGYLARILAFFPELRGRRTRPPFPPILHVFAGTVRGDRRRWLRLDLRRQRGSRPEILGSVYDVERLTRSWRDFGNGFPLVLADPPYSPSDAEKYGTPMIDRGRATRAIADVTAPGGHLVWLDTTWPMHTSTRWRTVGRITIVRSTNHRIRMASIFERRSR